MSAPEAVQPAAAARSRRFPLSLAAGAAFFGTDVEEVDVHADDQQHDPDDDQDGAEERQHGRQPEGERGQVHLPLEVHPGDVGELRRVGGVESLTAQEFGVCSERSS